MRYIDVHCHINGEDYGDVDSLFGRVRAVGVRKIITVGFDMPSSLYGRELAERYPYVYFTAGFHPTELKKYRAGDLDKVAEFARHDKCVAIGEIGLDYHYPDTDRALQHELFNMQLDLAAELGLPVQIHSRDSAEDTAMILRERAQELTGGFLLHCYSHAPELARVLEKQGGYFSFGGVSTYSGSKRIRRSVAAIGLDRLLTETDSPYMPPLSKRGEFPNTPEGIPEITRSMAEIKGVSEELMSETVWENAHRLFKKLDG